MKENDLYAGIREDCKKIRGAVVMKHADRFTRDIPDFEVCVLGGSSWGEIKLRRPGETLKKVVDRPTQILFANQLAVTCGGRSWVIIYEQEPRRVVVWQPRILFGHLWPNVAGPTVHELGCEPVEVDRHAPGVNIASTLFSVGVIAVDWSYEILRTLVTQSLVHP